MGVWLCKCTRKDNYIIAQLLPYVKYVSRIFYVIMRVKYEVFILNVRR